VIGGNAANGTVGEFLNRAQYRSVGGFMVCGGTLRDGGGFGGAFFFGFLISRFLASLFPIITS
jgi:hypothetical protein